MSPDNLEIITISEANIDLEALDKIKTEVEAFLSKGSNRILVDLSSVNYLSSTGLGLLVYINNACNTAGGRFGIFGLQEYTLDMIKMTKLDSVISVYTDQNEAEEAFNQ